MRESKKRRVNTSPNEANYSTSYQEPIFHEEPIKFSEIIRRYKIGEGNPLVLLGSGSYNDVYSFWDESDGMRKRRLILRMKNENSGSVTIGTPSPPPNLFQRIFQRLIKITGLVRKDESGVGGLKLKTHYATDILVYRKDKLVAERADRLGLSPKLFEMGFIVIDTDKGNVVKNMSNTNNPKEKHTFQFSISEMYDGNLQDYLEAPGTKDLRNIGNQLFNLLETLTMNAGLYCWDIKPVNTVYRKLGDGSIEVKLIDFDADFCWDSTGTSSVSNNRSVARALTNMIGKGPEYKLAQCYAMFVYMACQLNNIGYSFLIKMIKKQIEVPLNKQACTLAFSLILTNIEAVRVFHHYFRLRANSNDPPEKKAEAIRQKYQDPRVFTQAYLTTVYKYLMGSTWDQRETRSMSTRGGKLKKSKRSKKRKANKKKVSKKKK